LYEGDCRYDLYHRPSEASIAALIAKPLPEDAADIAVHTK
jgi:hypothetical protein